MKNLKLGISAVALLFASTVFAQTKTNPWMIGVGAHGENHMPVGGNFGGSLTNFGQVFSINNFTITPPLSKLTVARNLNKALVLDWETSVGNVDNKRMRMDKEFFLMTGLGIQYKFNSLWSDESWFDPYVRIGANYLRHDYTGVSFPLVDANEEPYKGFKKNDLGTSGKSDFLVANGGLGINFWFTKNFGLGTQLQYAVNTLGNSDVPNFWQASSSLLFRFGNRDKDKDGILDENDECPDTPGLAQFKGCPDTDGDGVPDKDDACVDVAGPVENNGCPWLDTDGDGVLDKDDKCPDVAGPRENNGCPWLDTDGDGILDKDDACPKVFGLKEYRGCPKPTTKVAEELTKEFNNLLFNFGKATLRPESNQILDDASKVIIASKGTFLVEGHTDKKGSDAFNLKLSKERAASVVKALESRGVDAVQLKSVGLGEKEATVAENAPDSERLKDRKVVVKYVTGADWTALKKSDVQELKELKKAVDRSVKKKKK